MGRVAVVVIVGVGVSGLGHRTRGQHGAVDVLLSSGLDHRGGRWLASVVVRAVVQVAMVDDAAVFDVAVAGPQSVEAEGREPGSGGGRQDQCWDPTAKPDERGAAPHFDFPTVTRDYQNDEPALSPQGPRPGAAGGSVRRDLEADDLPSIAQVEVAWQRKEVDVLDAARGLAPGGREA